MQAGERRGMEITMTKIITIGKKMYEVSVGSSYMFRELSETEEQEFIQWVKDNAESFINPLHHPVIQDYIIKKLRGKI